MPGQRRFGMDHPHYDWSPVVTRKKLSWPGDARVALCLIVNLEHLEWTPPENSFQTPSLYNRPLPDYRGYSHREYGHRVGIFRVLDVLQKHGISATVAMDALTAQNYPYLVNHCLRRGCEIIGHGISVSQVISSKMSEDEERAYIRKSITALEDATGSAPRGWLGPEYGESARTPALLAEAGVDYLCDWANDEQPYLMKTPLGRLFALPVMLDMNDAFALSERGFPVHEYAEMVKDGFDTMYADAATSGRLLALNLHPWIMGQPFRISYLDEVLGHVMSNTEVWAATGGQIIDWYKKSI